MSEPDDPGPSTMLVDRQSVPVDAGALVDAATAFRRALGVPDDAIMSITLADEDEIASLAERAFGDRHVTDVVSFGVDDPSAPAPGPLVLGDIVVCPAFAGRNAAHLGRSLADELERLVAHGLLHLMGLDHATPADEIAMARAERALAGSLR